MNFIQRLLCSHHFVHECTVPLMGNPIVVRKCKHCGKKKLIKNDVREDRLFAPSGDQDCYINWDKMKGGK